MNQRKAKLILKFITFLQKKYDSYILSPDTQSTSYHSLSPINNADGGEYEEAMLWALQNRKSEDIKNVALTGPYGSGKSSILKTFQEKYKSKFNFLNISLATFKEELIDVEEKTGDENGKPQDKDLLRLIELSILQQIFYHEEDEKIPDSRFKKIRSFKKSNLVFIASSVLVLMICCFDLFAPEKFKSVFHLTFSANVDLFTHLVALALFIAGTYIMLLRSVRLVNSIKISKFKFKDAEIEIDKNNSKTILNNHLDEILYFFEVTPYDVVIIEDLDRFQQTEIFTKLRELNLLINNSKKVKRDIVFIYAVRDDMFRDKDRTKFFDFIVPIIPVINSSNSNEKLLGVIHQNNYKVSDDLVDDISLFIDDMRLLYNITNEYYIYHSKLDKKLDQNKLLAMIVYKNIHPNDFVNLSNGSGELFGVLNNRDLYIKNSLSRIDNEIETSKSEISTIDILQITNISELRRLYILEYVSKLPGITAFEIDGNDYLANQVLDDEIFDYFKKNKARYAYLINHYGSGLNRSLVNHNFADIEKIVDPKNSYAQREARIKSFHASKTETLKLKIAELEKEKVLIRHSKLKDIILSGDSKIQLNNGKQNLLVNILLRNGYIDEDYLDYISIFYEGSISKEDRQFLLNVKSQIALDFDFKLNKVEKLIAKIGLLEFEKEHILNYRLMDYLLKAPAQKLKLNALLEVLSNQSARSLEFIEGYIDNGKPIVEFIKQLTKRWPGIWKYVNTLSTFTYERKLEYYRLIMGHADIADITKVSAKSDLIAFTTEYPNFLTLLADKEKTKQIITTFKIKFTELVLAGAPTDLVDFVYEGNHYCLSIDMLKKILEVKNAYSEADFKTQNYTAIQNSKQTRLIEYVNENIDEYISDIYLELEKNVDDTGTTLIFLLNNTNISLENRVSIVEKCSVKISDITTIKETEIQVALLENNKLEPVWHNVIPYYHDCGDELDEIAIGFIDEEANAEALSALKINKDLSGDELQTVNKFLKSLVAEDSISDDSYGKLMKSVPYSYSSIAFENVSMAKVNHLINTSTLGITSQNFNYLKINFDGQHIYLLEKWHTDFVKKIADFELDEADQVKLLQSTSFTMQEKQTIYQSLKTTEIVASKNLSITVGTLLLENVSWIIDKETLKHILTHSLRTVERIKLFNTRFKLFGKADVTEILKAMPQPYSDIAIPGKRPVLDHGQENQYLANNLKTLDYISRSENERKGIRINTFKK